MPFTQYQGLDVLEALRDRYDAAPDDHTRAFDLLASPAGAAVSRPVASAPHADRDFVWKAISQAEVGQIKAFIDAHKGRLIPFWVPSLDRNFELASFPGVGASWTIRSVGYTANLFPGSGARRHVFARHPISGFVYRKVIAAVDNGNGTETLTLESVPGVNIANDLWLVGFLKLFRLSVDEVEFTWASREFATARFPLTELPHEAPL